MNRAFIALAILLYASGCYLLNEPLNEMDYTVGRGSYRADSMLIDSAGLYEFVINASSAVDIIFLSSSEAIGQFEEGELYSQYILYPLFFEGTVYEDEEVFIYDEGIYIYFIIDNTDFLTSSVDDSELSMKVYLKEE